MASLKPKGLEFRHGSWWARMTIPADVRLALGKTTYLENLKTNDVLEARQKSEVTLGKWRQKIAAARAGASPEAIEAKAKAWAESQRYTRPQGLMASELMAEFGLPLDSEDHYLDSKTAALFRHGLMAGAALRLNQPVPVLDAVAGGDPALKKALAMSGTLVAKAHHADLQTAEFEAEAYGKPLPRVDGPKPIVLTGTTLRSLFDQFITAHPKRHATLVARNKQYLRRLGEFMDDGDQTDAGLVTKAKATAFWNDLRLFPARRSAMQNAWPFPKVIAGQRRAQGTDAFQPTQTDATLATWLNFYRQLFQFAVENDLVATDPWVVIKHKVDKSELKGSAYSPGEIEKVFSGALFTGHTPDEKWRITPGDKVFKDAKFWLPVIALFSGTRMSEVAAAPLESLVQIDGVWCLDLKSRAVSFNNGPRVKNSASRRFVPIHQELIRLGLIDYAERMREHGEVWLFPDLDHESKHGPGHGFSKFWGERQKKIGVKKTYHHLRHTWKRAARAVISSEERSDLLSGHGSGSIGRKYAAGLDVALLKAEMDKISFPTFPL